MSNKNYDYFYQTNDLDIPRIVSLNRPEFSTGSKDLHLNGMCTNFPTLVSNMQMQSDKWGGINVYAIFTPTQGGFKDFLRAAKERILIKDTDNVKLTQYFLTEFLNKEHEDAHLLLTPHSEGCIIACNAIENYYYKDDIKSRLEIVLFGFAKIIDKKYANRVIHYASKRDPVAKFVGLRGCKDHSTVILLEPARKTPWFDHGYHSDTVSQAQSMEFENFKKKYGVLQK